MASPTTSGDTDLVCLSGTTISIKLTDGQTFSGHTTENIVLRQITTTNDASDTPPTAPTDVVGGGIVTGGDQSPTPETTTTETPDSPFKQCGLFEDDKPNSNNDEDSTDDASDSDNNFKIPGDAYTEQQDAPTEKNSGSDNNETEDAATENPTDATMEEQDAPTENNSGRDNDETEDAATENPTDATMEDIDAPTAPTENPTNPTMEQPDAPTDNPTKSKKKRSIVSSDSEMTTSDDEEDGDDFGDDDDDESTPDIVVCPTKRLKQYLANTNAPYVPKKDEVPDAPTMVLAEMWHNNTKNFYIIDKVNKSNTQPDSHFTIEEQTKKLYPFIDSSLSYLNCGTTRLSRQVKVVENITKYHLFGEMLEIPPTLLDEDERAMVIKLLGVLTQKLVARKSKWDALAYIISTYNLRADTYYLESWYPGPGRRGEPTFANLYGAGWNTAA